MNADETNKATDSDQQVIKAAVDAWEAGHVTPHDALTLIRDQLRGTPIAAGPDDIKEGRWELP